jgi:hypothetical protein
MSGKTHIKKHTQNRGINELIYKQGKEEYAYIEILNGGSPPRFVCRTLMDKTVNAYLKGSLIKGPGKKRVDKGDLVLLEKDPTTTEKDKFVIIWKYSEEEKKKLTKMGELKGIAPTNEDTNLNNGTNIQFEGDNNVKEEEEINIADI